jgi:hypothetical protein
MYRLSRWLGERPHRTTALNILMLTLLLAMLAQPSLFLLVGGLTVSILALSGLRGAFMKFRSRQSERHPYEMLYLWAPGGTAIVLAALGLWLISGAEAGSAVYLLGVFLFGFEAALLVLLGADLRSDRAVVAEAR